MCIAKLTLACTVDPVEPLLLIGSGGHARSVIDVVESTGIWRIVGLVGRDHQIGSKVLGYPVVGTDAELARLHDHASHAVVAIGHLGSPEQRIRLVSLMQRHDFDFPVIASAHAVISRHASIGAGSTIGHGAVVNASARIGAHCIINSQALIEHDATVGDHCHISTGVRVNGGVHIGSGSFIGSGAILREGLVIPQHTCISAGKRVMGWPLREG